MEPGVEIELRALFRQKPMNEVIERGDSAVQQFYNDAVVFVTGGSGFLGKQFIEKLFRSCKLKKLYLLIRSKRGKTIQQRFDYFLNNPVFDLLRVKQPQFADRIILVEGDVLEPKLGLSDEDWGRIAEEVNIIFHMAATVQFDEPLKRATLINVHGTMKIIHFAKECKKLKQFIYVSTAYCQATEERVGKEVMEQFYPTPMSPNAMVQMAQSMDEQRLINITPELIKGWPNTYTFTKALAEEVVRTSAGDLPVCIVKPPIVLPTYYEPSPGWLDMAGLSGPSGILFGVILGIIHVFFVDSNVRLALVPLDYVNNAIIGAAWDSAERRKEGDTDIPIYIVANEESLCKWELLSSVIRNNRRKLASPLAAWYAYVLETKNKLVYLLLCWYLHYIPAYILDGVCAVIGKRPKGIDSFFKVYKSVGKKAAVYNYFAINDFLFRDKNVKAMLNRMSAADRAIFNCDLTDIDFSEYSQVWCIGIRKYILKDGLKDSVTAYKRQRIFKVANIVFLIIYSYALWYVARTLMSVVNFVIFH